MGAPMPTLQHEELTESAPVDSRRPRVGIRGVAVVVLATLAVGVAVVLAARAGQAPTGTPALPAAAPAVLTLPTWDAKPPYAFGSGAGILRGEVIGAASACLWLTGTDGARTLIVWPAGYTARAESGGLTVLDQTGKPVAMTGRFTQVGMGLDPNHDARGCPGTFESVIIISPVPPLSTP